MSRKPRYGPRPAIPTTGGEQRDLDDYNRMIEMMQTEAGREQFQFEIEDIKIHEGWRKELEENWITFFGGPDHTHISDIQYHGGMYYAGEW